MSKGSPQTNSVLAGTRLSCYNAITLGWVRERGEPETAPKAKQQAGIVGLLCSLARARITGPCRSSDLTNGVLPIPHRLDLG